MPALALGVASPLNASNNTYYSLGDGAWSLGVTGVPSDLRSVTALSWTVEFNQTGRVDDTLSFSVRIMSGSTVLAAADADGTYVVVSSNVTNTADITVGPTAFPYVNSAAPGAAWNTASFVMQQTTSASMANDGAVIRVDFAQFTGTYVEDAPLAAPTVAVVGRTKMVDVEIDTPPVGTSSFEYSTDNGVTVRELLPSRFQSGVTEPVKNAQGADSSASLTSAVSLAVQSDGKIIVGGAFTFYDGVLVNRIARLNTDGSLDTGFNVVADGTVGTSGNVNAIATQSDGKIVIGGVFATARGVTQSYIARLNSDGSLDTGFNTGGTVGTSAAVNAVAIQSDGKIVIGGSFLTARGVTQNRIARLNTDGSLDTEFNVAADGTVGVSSTVNAIAIQSDGKIVIGGAFLTARGTTQSAIARLNTDGSLDAGFNVVADGTVGTSGNVNAIAIQSDGKIVIGGDFTTAREVTQNRIARLNSDGSLDTGFNTGGTIGVSSTVNAVAIQSDGKIVIGGAFLTARGTTQNRIARLNTDGTRDTGYNLSADGTTGVDDAVTDVKVLTNGKIVICGNFVRARNACTPNFVTLTNTGAIDNNPYRGMLPAKSAVNAVVFQSDGKLLAGGSFFGFDGEIRRCMLRINPDRTLDPFITTAASTLAITVNAIAVQSDGKIVIGGSFTTYLAATRNRIARLNTDGSLDTGFNVAADGTVGVSNTVNAVAIQSDGKIVVGGAFVTARGVTQNRIARLNTDGSLDTGFNIGTDIGVDGTVGALAVQSDGKIVIGGDFTTARGVTQNRIARLNTDGSLDTGFNTDGTVGTSNTVNAIAIQSDGKIVIGGDFTFARGVTQNNIARLNSDGSRDTGFNTGGTVGTSGTVRALAIQSDGKIVVGGLFALARGVTQNNIARLNTDGSLDTSFQPFGPVGVTVSASTVAVNDIDIHTDGRIAIGGNFQQIGEMYAPSVAFATNNKLHARINATSDTPGSGLI
jgi:uncharacterized delta-60 repeat protein